MTTRRGKGQRGERDEETGVTFKELLSFVTL